MKIEAVDTDKIATNKINKGEDSSLSNNVVDDVFDKVNQDR